MKTSGRGIVMTTLEQAHQRGDLGHGPPPTVPVGTTAIPHVGSTKARPGPRTKVPWIVLTDGVSLLVALAAASTRISLDGSDGRLLLAALVASSLYVWFLFQQFRSLATIIRRRRGGALAMPVAAVASAALVLGVGGIALPWTELVLFIALWSAGLLIGRMVVTRSQDPLKVLLIGSPRFLPELAGRRDVEVVCLDEPPPRVNGWDIVATDPAEQYDREWLQWISHADMHDIKVISAPLLLETLTDRVPTEMLHGRWALEVLAGSSQYQFWKRLLDVVAIILLAPILLALAVLVALLVWLDSGRPVLFHQTRVGLGGQPFRMVKFRTMLVDAERDGSAFASHGDARVTRIGAFLRQYRLDEIPQFWNVLKGEMSIIGPRPEQLSFAAQFDEQIPLYQLRHNVRPGISGWAQVKQGYAANSIETETKLRYDFYYVKHFSFALDAAIVWRTVMTILTGFGSR
jgi:lipopolysaccharide/colanic/teichoic acid biosynthesis glycosyltransferase